MSDMAAVDVDAIKQRATAAYKAFTPAQLVLAALATIAHDCTVTYVAPSGATSAQADVGRDRMNLLAEARFDGELV